MPKEQLTLRLDADVLKWFKSKGKRYQTRINALLRAYMVASRAARRAVVAGRLKRKPKRKAR